MIEEGGVAVSLYEVEANLDTRSVQCFAFVS